MGTFIPNTKEEQLQMLNDIGYKDWDDLFKDIPAAARIKGELNIPAGKSELELLKLWRKWQTATWYTIQFPRCWCLQSLHPGCS